MGPKDKQKNAKQAKSRLEKKDQKKMELERKSKRKAKAKQRAKSQEKKRVVRTNKITKQHKKKLLDAKRERQRHRNIQMMRLRRRLQAKRKKNKLEKDRGESKQSSKSKDQEVDDDFDTSSMLEDQYKKEESYYTLIMMYIEDCLAGLLYFLTVTLRSERTFDWLVFLANNLGLYQEYEINDYGQRLSPRTGRPVLLSLGPLRVVQIVESANQVRSFWDPYIRDYLRNSNLTTDCWRANRMAMQVALCMDDAGIMHDMPLYHGDDHTESIDEGDHGGGGD